MVVLLIKLKMGQVQIGAAPRKTKQRNSKSLQTTSLCYLNAKFTLKVPLTLDQVEKINCEDFDYVHLVSSFSFFFLISS